MGPRSAESSETNFVPRRPLLAGGALLPVCLLTLAIGLRLWAIENISLNHFDEGVFVSGAFGVWLHGPWHFPLAQPLQAPPLYPWMIAGTFWLTQMASPSMAIYLCAALGSATVGLYWALLRRLYGPRFALLAAALLAASDLHIAFSRMALTDVPLTFWFVASTYCLTRLTEVRRPPAKSSAAQSWPKRVARYVPAIGWCLAAGLTAGAAWTTKYNGWMWLAMAATAWLIVAARGRLKKRWGSDARGEQSQERFSRAAVLVAIGVAALVSVGCFAPWYVYVERTVEGGYRAVTENHLRYFGGIRAWPSRAGRLWLSLTAFRHFGWIATMAGLSIGLAWYHVHRKRAAQSGEVKNGAELAFTLLAGLALLLAMLALGSDAVMTAIAAAAIVPALIWGGWAEVVFAVWTGSFLIMTPFYHPYTRLLVPALPAEIVLTVWLIVQAFGQTQGSPPGSILQPGNAHRLTSRTLLALACSCVFMAALTWRPFGWLPIGGAWNRWSTRQSYRALGDAVREAQLPADALVLCHGPPAMTLYLDREWAPLEFVPFDLWLPHIDRGRDCYLAADYWGLYAENHQLVRQSISQRIRCLQPLAVVPNDLNLVTLLDYLPAAEVAEHVSLDWPAKHLVDSQGREVIVPADLMERRADIIVLYRIDRECLDQLR